MHFGGELVGTCYLRQAVENNKMRNRIAMPMPMPMPMTRAVWGGSKELLKDQNEAEAAARAHRQGSASKVRSLNPIKQ